MSVLEFSVKTATLGGDAFVVTLAGELDLHTAPELEQALEGVVGLGGTAVAVDLAEVTFIDSTTLEVLLRYHERFRGLGGALVIVTDDRRMLRTFEITGLDRVFTIERRLADAVAAILPDSAPTS
ncbi:MAG TPA: STAS domain-containing protein [Gaiellaceae bacterium]|nr:STAS domain-containing protein [Gaiellaceae bacterium]